MADNLKFVIPGKPDYITMVRLAVGSIADTAGFDYEEIEDIKTAVSEACKNITCHGSEGFAEEYEVECVIEKEKIQITVRDTSEGHNLKKLKKPCLDCPNEGDLSLYVIKTLMSDVEIIKEENCKNTIKMTKAK
ncbi:MAG: ATP-binding protein [Firmicutes bacterium]|nr:ATP-binding protein [Bacillota bacterium]